MRVFTGAAALEAAAGDDLGFSEWHTIDQARIDAFAETTNDRQWIHVDPERAAETPTGATIAHGYLTLSLIASMMGEIYRVEGVTMLLNYGLNRVRFPSPVPVGSRVRAHARIAAVEPGERGVQVVFAVTIEIEGADRPACVAEPVVLVVP
ncbi:MaoC family dehydratase [Leucobacter sp. UCMA 4100]|uniref:MaoC family dehydratase n=1 Tax=Leucobacter sp. UCMA 4100 TaxID=2810534 RepID=UPI0022EB87C1|nr:MaoC family dehydratase [Leucobacter sp. UCMA 4100]MDA3146841.1 MaoC family dehydratase [Leucobacter sp. UCMA 4100]